MTAWVLPYIKYARSQLATLAVLNTTVILGAGLAVLQPWPLKLLVDYTLAGETFPSGWTWVLALPGAQSPVGQVAWLSAFTMALWVARFLVGFAGKYAETAMGHRMIVALGGDVFDHLQRLSPRFHTKHAVGDLVRRATIDVSAIRDLVLNVATPLLTSTVMLAAMFSVMWLLNKHLALLALAIAAPLVLVIRLFSKPMARLSYEQQEAEGDLMALAEQTLTAIPLVQTFRREPLEDSRYRSASGRSARAYLKSTLSQLYFKTGVDGVTALGSAAIVTIGGLHVLTGRLTVGGLLVLLSYLAAVYAPLQTLAYLSSGYANAAGMARRVSEILKAGDRVVNRRDVEYATGARSQIQGEVRIEEVTFGYGQHPVIHNASLWARPGETVALVGPTGAGKSTVLSLIPRIYDPWDGRITVDGHDVRSLPLEELRSFISIVLQEPFLLPMTVAENIAYGRPNATHGEIVSAAVKSGADIFIRKLADGYDTHVGERGCTLSGGEKQRISFARALLKNAPILILDEPTSAVDAETEAIMVEGLNQLMEDRTTFVIAHRLSTVRKADRIYVLDHGRVVEQGTQTELLSSNGLYRDFHDKQVRPKPRISITAR